MKHLLYCFSLMLVILLAGCVSNNTTTTTIGECQSNRDCWDLKQDCYWVCDKGQCSEIYTLVALCPYPNCDETPPNCGTTTTTLPETTLPTTTTIATTTTTPENVEQGIAITSTKSGAIAVKNIGRVREIYASALDLYINGQKIDDPKWTFTVIYSTSSMTSRVTCNVGDTIRVVAPGNEDSGICTA